MRGVAFFVVFSAGLICARADLTIVQRVEGRDADVIVKIKGDKERIEAASAPTQIIDGKTGEVIDLMNEKKTFVRIPAVQMKAAAQTMEKLDSSKPEPTAPKLTPTGQKKTVSGYETEEFVYKTPRFTARFWVATKFPNADSILKQLQAPIVGPWKPSNLGMPDYTDFQGVPLQTVVSGKDGDLTTTIISIKQDALSDAEFVIPPDFQEEKRPLPSVSPTSESSVSPSPAVTP